MMQYVRHPMYGGLLLAAVGFAAATGDELRMLLALAFFLLLDTKVMGRGDGPAVGQRAGPAWALQRLCGRHMPLLGLVPHSCCAMRLYVWGALASPFSALQDCAITKFACSPSSMPAAAGLPLPTAPSAPRNAASAGEH